MKVLDLERKLTFMSEAGQRVMEVSDHNTLACCPWPDFWADKSNTEAKTASWSKLSLPGCRLHAAGSPHDWAVKVSAILGRDGKPESILSVSRDTTEFKAAEIACSCFRSN